MRATGEDSEEASSPEVVYLADLLCGIGPKHINILCGNSWEGGRQYTPRQVGDMTLDMILMLLADRKILRASGMKRVVKGTEVKVESDGLVTGRTKDGKTFRAKVGGKSLARQLMEEEAAKEAAAKAKRPRRRRGG